MNRAIFLLHRYLGIALGMLISVWCLSGVVMMYVEYPEMAPEDEAASLTALDLASCCRLPDDIDSSGAEALDDLRIEMLGDSPVLRLAYASGARRTIALSHGSPIGPLDPAAAGNVAASFARRAGIADFSYGGELDRDQWTVYGAYDVHRPLHKFVGADDAGTEWYVSSRTGEIVQITTASERFWNWLGAVPHWLYPTILRQHTTLWSQVVIWLTVVATFLTVLGMYVGLRQFRSRRSGRYSPYRGTALWHHYAGLFFGILMFTWLVSGFFSMNPWGALEGRSFDEEIARQQGSALRLGPRLLADISTLASHDLPDDTVRLQGHIVDSRPFFVAWDGKGNRHLLDETFEDVLPFTSNAILEAAARIRPGQGLESEGWIDADDAYYFSHHEKRALPVYRIIYADGERYYLDALTGEIVLAVDRERQLYRWLHYALHRGDFATAVRERPVWDAFMLPLMLGVSLSGLTGTWIGLRRIRRSLRSGNRRGIGDRRQLTLESAQQG